MDEFDEDFEDEDDSWGVSQALYSPSAREAVRLAPFPVFLPKHDPEDVLRVDPTYDPSQRKLRIKYILPNDGWLLLEERGEWGESCGRSIPFEVERGQDIMRVCCPIPGAKEPPRRKPSQLSWYERRYLRGVSSTHLPSSHRLHNVHLYRGRMTHIDLSSIGIEAAELVDLAAGLLRVRPER